MKKIYLDIDDSVLKQVLKDSVAEFGFVVSDDKDCFFVLRDNNDSFFLNDIIIPKPIDIFYLVSKLNDISEINFNGLYLLKNKRQITFMEKSVSLTDIENKILSELMVEKNGILVSDLSNLIFGKANESNLKSLATHIYNIKKKIEKLTGNKKNILLEKSRYRLNF